MKLLLVVVVLLLTSLATSSVGSSKGRTVRRSMYNIGRQSDADKNQELVKLMGQELNKLGLPAQTAASAVFDYVVSVQPAQPKSDDPQDPWNDYAKKVDDIMNKADLTSTNMIKKALNPETVGNMTTEKLAYHCLELINNLRRVAETNTRGVVLYVENAAFDARPVETTFDNMYNQLAKITDPLTQKIAEYIPKKRQKGIAPDGWII